MKSKQLEALQLYYEEVPFFVGKAVRIKKKVRRDNTPEEPNENIIQEEE